MSSRIVFLHAWTPVHSGTGQGVGSIDLPIARERATNLPLIPGSSIKGCLRDSLPQLTIAERNAIFGPETITNENGWAGALRVGDARLTLLPVRSLTATFVWAACPFVLRRLKRDAEACGIALTHTIPVLKRGETAVTSTTELTSFGVADKKPDTRLVLEEIDLKPVGESATAAAWASWFAAQLFPGDAGWKAEFEKRFAIVDDETFTFLAEFATEVNAHIKIKDDRGTVEEGMLWYQECLPAETVLVSAFQADATRVKSGVELEPNQVFDRVALAAPIQLGGKATTGLGVVKMSMMAAGGAA